MKLAIHKFGIIVLLAGASFTSIQAASTTLLNLTDGGTLTSGNLVFSDFGAVTRGNVIMPFSDITVATWIDGDGNMGILFNDGWGLGGNGSTSPAQSYTLDFSFLVTETDAAELIKANTFGFSELQESSSGSAPANSTTAVTIKDNQAVYGDSTPMTMLGSGVAGTLSFAGQSAVWVTCEIDMSSSTNLCGSVSESNFRETFQETAVPEPGTLALVGVGACGLVCLRRKQKA
ncbi:MAG: PEP-CTERM sorting domain-containing protein [Verrucomicrobiae bacterium]|nr:PEP-CTERM sorting domain-containing protein [Verrucomicrobiae bacterium]